MTNNISELEAAVKRAVEAERSLGRVIVEHHAYLNSVLEVLRLAGRQGTTVLEMAEEVIQEVGDRGQQITSLEVQLERMKEAVRYKEFSANPRPSAE